MEVLFTFLLLIVPIFSVVSLFVSLVALKQAKALKSLTLSLVSTLRGNDASPLQAALDDYALKV